MKTSSLIPTLSLSIATLLTVVNVRAQTWNLAAGGSWNTAANWNPAVVPNAVGASVTFNGAATASNPAQTANRTVTTDGPQTVGSIVFNNDLSTFNNSITTGTGGSLTFDASGTGPATITVPAAPGTGNNTISVATTLNDTLVATVNNITASSAAGALNLTAAISGSGGFIKQGDGLCTLGTATKTYAGPTVTTGGRLRITQSGHPTQTSSLTVNAGAQLTLNTGGIYTFGSGPLNLNGTGASSGPFAIFLGAMRNDRNTSPITINNAVVLQTDTLIHVQANNGTGSSSNPGATNTLAGIVSGPGKLTFTAPNSDADQGFLVLNGANTYSGGTLVNGGFLVASGSAATFGTGNVTIDHAASPSSIARMRIESGVVNAIADTATLSLAGGRTAGVADEGYADLGTGVNETVGALILGGVTQGAGTYGSTASSATTKDDEYFTGTGIITVVSAEPRPSLAIHLSSPNVVVTWPTNAANYTLEERTNLENVTLWTTNTDAVTVVGTNNTVTIFSGATQKYFRLIR